MVKTSESTLITHILDNPLHVYHELIMGGLKVRSVYDDNNNHVYDLLYITVYDKNDKCTDKSIINQTGTTLYNSNVVNIRDDLINTFGLAGTKETLPLWLPEYESIIPVAFIKPGIGQELLTVLTSSGYTYNGLVFGVRNYILLNYTSYTSTYDKDIIVPDPAEYPILCTTDNNGDLRVVQSSLVYVYSDLDQNTLTVDQFDLESTITQIEAAALVHAIAGGRAEAVKTDDPMTSDYRAHENVDGDLVIFDDDATIFDFTMNLSGSFLPINNER